MDDNEYEHFEGSYIGQLNKKAQRHGFGIWKTSRNFENQNIKMIYGEWEYDDLLNGQIIYKSGASKIICPHGVPPLNFMQTAIKVDFLKNYKESKDARDKKN